MLKTLKWVYELGVRQERQRIAAILQGELQQRAAYNQTMHDVINDTKLESQKDKMLKRLAVSSEVSSIVNRLFETQYHENYVSLMFPEEKK